MTFKAGTVVKDTRRDLVGTYMDKADGKIWIRPIGGGLEWGADLVDVRTATPSECAGAQAALLSRKAPR